MENYRSQITPTKDETNQVYLHEPRGCYESTPERQKYTIQTALFACVLKIVLNNVRKQTRNKLNSDCTKCETK